MHVEAAMAAHESGKPPLRIAHLEVVAGLLRLLEKAFGPSPFTARCSLLTGLVQESASWYAQARSLFQLAQKQLTQDPRPAFALALLDVDMAAKTGLGCDQAATAGRRRPSAAATLASQRAEEGLRLTLERDPGHEEAHLRLGQLLLVTGRKADAAVELQWVTDEAQLPADRFVAELLLGSLADGEGRTEAAAARYRTALEMEPNAQIVKVALSDVLNRMGRRERARELMSELVAAGPVAGDAWLTYCTPDPSRAFWKLLPEIRGEATR
jgi:tetratricopeptide (TPR) repeat protein